jgi:hypothetical protein
MTRSELSDGRYSPAPPLPWSGRALPVSLEGGGLGSGVDDRVPRRLDRQLATDRLDAKAQS